MKRNGDRQTNDGRESYASRASSSLSIEKDAIDVLIRRLSRMPSSAEVDLLMKQAKEQRAEVGAWELSPPGSERLNELMKRTLELHFEVVSLERGAPMRRGW